MFINDIFNDKNKALNEVSNELLGRYKKAAGADATAADKRGDVEQGNKRFKGIVKATVKQGDNDAKKHKAQGVAEGSSILDVLDVPEKVLRTAQDAARGMPTGTVPGGKDDLGSAAGDLANTATKVGKQVIDTARDAARGMPTGTVPKPRKDKGVDEQAPPLNVPQGWEAKTQADGSTRISKIGSMSSADYKQNMANYKAQNWTPEKMADYGQRMASGQGYTPAERAANYQQQQKSFGQYADQPQQDIDEARKGDTNFGSTVTQGSWVVMMVAK
jgi:HAMP domain-containing protein